MAGAIQFSIDEVLEMGQRIEENGAKFYRRAAEIVGEASDLLVQLAAQEDTHRDTFGAMREGLTDREKEAITFDPSDEGSMYLNAFVDTYKFKINQDPSAALIAGESLVDILAIAEGLEKDSIVFYTGLKSMIPKLAGMDKVDAIVVEELRHLSWINNKQAELRSA